MAEKGDEGLLFGLLKDWSASDEHDVSACGVPGWQSVCERCVGEEFEVDIMLCDGAAWWHLREHPAMSSEARERLVVGDCYQSQ